MDTRESEIVRDTLNLKADRDRIHEYLWVINEIKNRHRDGSLPILKREEKEINEKIKELEDKLKIFKTFLNKAIKALKEKGYENITPEFLLEKYLKEKADGDLNKNFWNSLGEETGHLFDPYWIYSDGMGEVVSIVDDDMESHFPKKHGESSDAYEKRKEKIWKIILFTNDYGVDDLYALVSSEVHIRKSISNLESDIAKIKEVREKRNKQIERIQNFLRNRFGNRFAKLLEKNGIKI
jgi:hypothetical protein